MVPLIGMTCLILALASPFMIIRYINRRRTEDLEDFCRWLMGKPPRPADGGEGDLPSELEFHPRRSSSECPDLSALCVMPVLHPSGRRLNVIEGTYRGLRVVTCDVRLMFINTWSFCVHPLGAGFPEVKVFPRVRLLRMGGDVDPFGLGMPGFCEAFRIECDSPGFVKQFFHPEMMKLILRHKQHGPFTLVLGLTHGRLVQFGNKAWSRRQFRDAMDFGVEFQRLIPKPVLDEFAEAWPR